MGERVKIEPITKRTTISSLIVDAPYLTPAHSLNDVAELFLSRENENLLSLPVVEEGRPIGVISRYQMMEIYMTLYGRELHGNKTVNDYTNKKPLIVSIDEELATASQYITSNIKFPITEDFVIVHDGIYVGVGMVIGLLKAMEDQFEQHNHALEQAYARLKSSQSQLVQSEKMASLGQMVAGVAHEINTPLGYVRGNIELTRDNMHQFSDLILAYRNVANSTLTGELELEQVKDLMYAVRESASDEDIDEMTNDLAQLITDSLHGIGQISDLVLNLKNFSRLDESRITDVNLNECIDSALVVGKNAIKHNATVIKEFSDLPDVHCVPSQINQVFLNLLTNASYAIEGKGKILIKTLFDSHNVYVSVEDSGKGMPQDVIKKIFDPFYTTKPIGEGTGLGLSISYQIIQQHGGTIRVNSIVNRGTKFLVSLPRQQESLKKTA